VTNARWRLRIEPGTSFRRRSQRYHIIGFRDYETRDGRTLELVDLASDSWDCGRPFEALATRRSNSPRTLEPPVRQLREVRRARGQDALGHNAPR
jgi:hypothetical protein